MKDYKINIGDEIICPVCGTVFRLKVEHRYIISGEYACNWNCFIDEVKRRDTDRIKVDDRKKKCSL